MSPLNLAGQPFRNERLPALLFLMAAFGLLLVTAQHAVIVYRLRPGVSRSLHAEVENLRKEEVDLHEEGGRLERVVATAQQRIEWTALRDLVDRRTFHWSLLLDVLEKILPGDVRIVALSPRVSKGSYELSMTVRAQSMDAGYGFVDLLSGSPHFGSVVVKNVEPQSQGRSEVELALNMDYLPAAAPSPGAAAEAR
jgi:Tfp pilus assembly protein PilN